MFSLTFGTKCGALAAILTIAAAVLSTPASATKVSEAVALCKKKPELPYLRARQRRHRALHRHGPEGRLRAFRNL